MSARGTPDSYTMDNYIQDLDIIRQQLGLQEIQLLEKSYGAMCALGYVLRFPKILTRMVLAAGSPSFKNLDSAKAHIAFSGSLRHFDYEHLLSTIQCKTLVLVGEED